jgi:hypothetical protein
VETTRARSRARRFPPRSRGCFLSEHRSAFFSVASRVFVVAGARSASDLAG